MKGCVDVEDVLADINAAFLVRFNQEHGTNFTRQDYGWDNFSKLRITPEQFQEYLGKIWQEDWKNIPPTESEIAAKVKQVADMGHQLDAVTARYNAGEYVRKWLDEYEIPYRQLRVLDLHADKSELDYDFFVDDAPKMAEKVSRKGKLLYLYDRPHNQQVQEFLGVFRVKSWSEILSHLTK